MSLLSNLWALVTSTPPPGVESPDQAVVGLWPVPTVAPPVGHKGQLIDTGPPFGEVFECDLDCPHPTCKNARVNA